MDNPRNINIATVYDLFGLNTPQRTKSQLYFAARLLVNVANDMMGEIEDGAYEPETKEQ